MLLALELDGRLITESDQSLLGLEHAFGPLGNRLEQPHRLKLRHLERQLFRAWCQWLCTPGVSLKQEQACKEQFQVIAPMMEQQIKVEERQWLDPASNTPNSPRSGCSDVVFIPHSKADTTGESTSRAVDRLLRMHKWLSPEAKSR